MRRSPLWAYQQTPVRPFGAPYCVPKWGTMRYCNQAQFGSLSGLLHGYSCERTSLERTRGCGDLRTERGHHPTIASFRSWSEVFENRGLGAIPARGSNVMARIDADWGWALTKSADARRLKRGGELAVGQPFNPYGMFHGAFVPEALCRWPKLNPGSKLCYALGAIRGGGLRMLPLNEDLRQGVGDQHPAVPTLCWRTGGQPPNSARQPIPRRMSTPVEYSPVSVG